MGLFKSFCALIYVFFPFFLQFVCLARLDCGTVGIPAWSFQRPDHFLWRRARPFFFFDGLETQITEAPREA